MDMMTMKEGTPWLDEPMMLEGSRDYECTLNNTDACEYQQGYWRYWYEADHRYALPTVALFCATLVLFTAGAFATRYFPQQWTQSKAVKKAVAINRYLSYRMLRISKLNWNSAPIGILLLGAVGVIFFFAMTLGPQPYYWPNTDELQFGDSPPIATRAGWMSLACLPFVIATSSKSNLITAFTGVSHEKLQVFHRWISYSMYVLALIHTFPFIVYNISVGEMVMSWQTTVFYWTGVVALLGMTWLLFASFSPLRNWSYELFKFTHYLAALVFIVFLFFHCDWTLTSWHYFIATGVIFSLAWLHSQIRTFFEHGIGQKAQLSLAANGFVRVAIPTTSRWVAGQHYFIRFVGLGIHAISSHPFTICSLPQRGSLHERKESELVFYIRPQGGLTARLASMVEQTSNPSVRVLLDGPYGGCDMRKIASSDRLLVIAGGSGAGFILPIVECFLRRLELRSLRDEKTQTQPKPTIRVILATRDIATRHWFDEAVGHLIASSSLPDAAKEVVVEVYYTGSEANAHAPKLTGQFLSKLEDPEKAPNADVVAVSSGAGSGSQSDTASGVHKRSIVQIEDASHRPNLSAAIRDEGTAHRDGKLGIFVCGPKSMQKDVGNAAAAENLRLLQNGTGEVYLHMEHFSWA